MRSMTGYGRGESCHAGWKATVELNSVNRRQLDLAVNLPREIMELEPRVRDVIQTAVSRGRLNAAVALHRPAGMGTAAVMLDETAARVCLRGIKKLKHDLKLSGTVSLDTLLRCPGVLKLVETEWDPRLAWPCVEKALRKALAGLREMQEKEGHHLARDLAFRVGLLEKGMKKIRAMAPGMIQRHRRQLHDRIRRSGIELSFEDDRLAKEIAFFADRSDITEELTRLKSHLAQFRDNLRSAGPSGRALDFLSQEIQREVNTIGGKAGDVKVSQTIVAMKAELEKIREQVQNVE